MDWVEEASQHLRYINIIGRIEPHDGEKFRHLVLAVIASGGTVASVSICSKGGDVEAAMDIGNQIRILGADTTAADLDDENRVLCIKVTGGYSDHVFGNYVKGANADCASAYFLTWVSGLRRGGTYIGVHRFTVDPTIYGHLTAMDAEKVYGEEMVKYKQFLVERGVPESIIGMTFAMGSTEMHYLTKDELQLLKHVPYLEELQRARCGEMPQFGVRVNDEGAFEFTTEDYTKCALNISKEIQVEGVKAYMAQQEKSP